MTLRLVIEHAPHAQPKAEVEHKGGELSIGRGPDADWQIVDPDMFISRRHCVITGGDNRYKVTDASRGGLYVDGAGAPLGAGNSVPLEHGMRLRLGDVVIRVEVEAAGQTDTSRVPLGQPAENAAAMSDDKVRSGTTGLSGDDFFAQRPPSEPAPPRPSSLPERFDEPPSRRPPESPERRSVPPLFDDPFSLDPLPERQRTAPTETRRGSDFFDLDEPSVTEKPEAPPSGATASWDLPSAPASNDAQSPDSAPAADAALHAAFFRGLGLSPDRLGVEAGPEEMEALGRRYRALVDGLLALLRSRALEKQNVRAAQTVIGRADVNPLKFLPSTDEALAALIVARGKGYLGPDEAITASFLDLTDHQTRSWSAMQTALRRMIDRFDPAEFERAAADDGRLQTLLAGGRGAQLWQLYNDRYQQIAKAAEERFLGEVGADFRDAYEGNGRT